MIVINFMQTLYRLPHVIRVIPLALPASASAKRRAFRSQEIISKSR